MQAADVMTTTVITVQPETAVKEIAGLLLKHRISAVPVVDAERRVIGIVSEGDLMRRPESETETRHAWWLAFLHSSEDRAQDYIKSHGGTAADVMTRDVVSVTEDTPLHEIATRLERHRIKRVPVTRDGRLVGIVSRANLLHGLAAKGDEITPPASPDDKSIRETLMHALSREAGLDAALMNVIVDDGAVQIWGLVHSESERRAAQVAAESTPGVKSVENHLSQVPAWIWAE